MNGGPIPFLWLCGPSGVGKSTVGWEIFTQLQRVGIRTGYLDTDQIGLCYPAPTDDENNHRVKARNLGALWPNYRAAGIRCFVLSGGVVALDTARTYADRVDGAALTLCRLRAEPAELRSRFVRRGWRPELAEESVVEAAELDRDDFADLLVDTDGLSVPEVARRVRAQAGGWPAL
jgi:hypothetical protein